MVTLQIEDELAAIIDQEPEDEPVERVAREMIVLELYRRGSISSGRAAELLGVPRIDFIKRTSKLGIPFIDMTEDEWVQEMHVVDAL
jgi:predicted HTH domain antitoxin